MQPFKQLLAYNSPQVAAPALLRQLQHPQQLLQQLPLHQQQQQQQQSDPQQQQQHSTLYYKVQ